MGKTKADIHRFPGPQQLTLFFQLVGDIFNMSEIERQCKFPSGTLRHVRTNGRPMRDSEYKKLQEILMPKMCELVFLLQNYQSTLDR